MITFQQFLDEKQNIDEGFITVTQARKVQELVDKLNLSTSEKIEFDYKFREMNFDCKNQENLNKLKTFFSLYDNVKYDKYKVHIAL